MARGDDFKENTAGVSSVLFYHASIIIHGERTPIYSFAIGEISAD